MTTPFPLLNSATQSWIEGRFPDAEDWSRRALVQDPWLADGWDMLSALAERDGQDDLALTRIERSVALAGPSNAHFPWRKGVMLYRQGRHREAAAAIGRSIEIDSHNALTWFDAGIAMLSDNPDMAFLCLGRSAVLSPEFGLAHQELGKMLQTVGQTEGALRRFRRALLCRPLNPDSHNDLGKICYEHKKRAEALDHFKRALILDPGHGTSVSNAGVGTEALRAYGAALGWYERAVRIAPNDAHALSSLGNCLQVMGRLTEADAWLEKAASLAPHDAKIQYAAAQQRKIRAGDPGPAAWEKLAASLPQQNLEDRCYLHFALAKAYEDLGERERAFDHLLTANAAKRALVTYDEQATRAKLTRTQQIFTPDFLQRLQGQGDPAAQPVFILGMPRSGSTLVEQILASHPDVFGAGELTDLPDMIEAWAAERGLGWPDLAATLSPQDLGVMGRRYAAAQKTRGGPARLVTDKSPGNFWMIGLIHLMLPNAKIIHTRRDPVDTCLSCFAKLFQDVAFTYDLGDLGRHWRIYQRMMAHWHEVLPKGVLFDIDYEALVADQAEQTRRLLDYCGLAWNDSVLAFHKNQRPVNTASVRQVRNPIYTDSAGRWRPAPEKLAPLLDALAAP
jgi:tetratricopeptide (TPR) repeat protein